MEEKCHRRRNIEKIKWRKSWNKRNWKIRNSEINEIRIPKQFLWKREFLRCFWGVKWYGNCWMSFGIFCGQYWIFKLLIENCKAIYGALHLLKIVSKMKFLKSTGEIV